MLAAGPWPISITASVKHSTLGGVMTIHPHVLPVNFLTYNPFLWHTSPFLRICWWMFDEFPLSRKALKITKPLHLAICCADAHVTWNRCHDVVPAHLIRSWFFQIPIVWWLLDRHHWKKHPNGWTPCSTPLTSDSTIAFSDEILTPWHWNRQNNKLQPQRFWGLIMPAHYYGLQGKRALINSLQ